MRFSSVTLISSFGVKYPKKYKTIPAVKSNNKKAIKPINDLHKEMASSLATLQLVVKQLNELALSEKDKNNVLDIVNSIDVDGMLDRLNAASDVIGVGEVELSFDGLDVDQLKI